METRKVVVKTKKTPPVKKVSRSEALLAEGLRFYNFVLPIEVMKIWCEIQEGHGLTPNEALLRLILSSGAHL